MKEFKHFFKLPSSVCVWSSHVSRETCLVVEYVTLSGYNVIKLIQDDDKLICCCNKCVKIKKKLISLIFDFLESSEKVGEVKL